MASDVDPQQFSYIYLFEFNGKALTIIERYISLCFKSIVLNLDKLTIGKPI